MSDSCILITAPSLDTKNNVSGISSVVNFIIGNNPTQVYKHFELGRKDNEKRNLWWLLGLIKTTFKWMFVVSSKKINIVHFNFALSKASIIRDAPLLLFAKLINKKIIIHLHGGDYLIKEKAPGWMQFVLQKIFSGNAPVIVLSPVEQQVLIKNYTVNNIKVLPNCVDLKDAKSFNRTYTPQNKLNLLFIGRISIHKGIEYIYQALILLKNKGVPFKFYMAGTGQEEKEYVEKFSALLAGDFEFKGVVSGVAKAALYKSSNVFILPSLFEGLPMSLLESMSFGLVPLVTDVGSIKFVVKTGENGIMLNQNPAADIAAAIENFISDTAFLQRLSKNASEFIFKNYDPDNYIAGLNSIYVTL
jgi:glycosyltransferase involved in cell wall biosynthesis